MINLSLQVLNEYKNFSEWQEFFSSCDPGQVGYIVNEAITSLNDTPSSWPIAVKTPEFWNAAIDDLITVGFLSTALSREQAIVSLGFAEKLMKLFAAVFKEDVVKGSSEAWQASIDMSKELAPLRNYLYEIGEIDKFGRQKSHS